MARGTARFSSVSGLLGYFTRHKTIANILLVLMIALGVVALPNLRAQFFPDVIIDNVTVRVSWDGAGAEDVDTGIVQVLEPALLAVEGVESSSAQSTEGSARITLEFEPGWDMGRAADDVQTAIDLVTTLPEDVDAPIVTRGAWRDRVTDIVITGPVAPEQLGLFADELVTRLFAAGVTRTTIRGVAARQVLVEVPSLELIAHDISMSDIARAIASEVDADPAGDVDGANVRVRVGAQKRTAQAVSQIVLRANPDGSTLRVADVARVSELGADRERSYFVGEHPAVSIRVDRSDAGDAISIQEQVETIAAQLESVLPAGVSVTLIRTRAEAITARLDILVDNAVIGLGLVVVLLFLFLNARTAFWVAAGIPVALLAAIGLMYLAGLTINMISLFGLIITLGIVVDDAIVVGEHTDHRYRKFGEDPFMAAENAARRMSVPVFAATLTTVVAFTGLLAVSGRFGDLIADIPITVILVLIASLVECFLILPHHMAQALSATDQPRWSRSKLAVAIGALLIVAGLVSGGLGFLLFPGGFAGPLDFLPAVSIGPGLLAIMFLLQPKARKQNWVQMMGRAGLDAPSKIVNAGFVWAREKLFRPFMAGVLAARYVVLAGVVALLASQVALFIRGDVQWRFFNAPERGSVTGNFVMAEGATRADTLDMMREMQNATERLAAEYEERFGQNPVSYVIAEIGGNAGRGLSGTDNKDADLLGGISIELIDADLRPYSAFAFVGELQDAVVRHPLVETVSFRGWRSGPGGDALDVEFYGADSDTLKAASEDLQRALAQYPEVSAVQDTLSYDKEELILDLTAQGQALGFTIDFLGRALRDRLNGIEAATFPDGPRSAEIRVELPKGELTADFLERTQMRTPGGAYVPLADIVSVERRIGFSTVRRENGIRLISVTGDISEDNPARATEIDAALTEEILPQIASERQVNYRVAGLGEQEDQFLNDSLTGLVLILTGIYVVLAWVFSSWARPFVVMAIIPFGLVGTIYGHHVWDVPLSMFTVVGLLGMTGIIINDSIVLVTTIDEYAAERGIFPAIIDGACDRLRPVVLTTLTTVLGMMPLLYEGSVQAEFLKPTVITLVYGLGFGMILVLLIVPALVAIQHDLARYLHAVRRAIRAPIPSVRLGTRALAAVLSVWFAVTVLYAGLWEATPPMISLLLSQPTETAPMLAALLTFVLGVLVLVLSAYAIGLFWGVRKKAAVSEKL